MYHDVNEKDVVRGEDKNCMAVTTNRSMVSELASLCLEGLVIKHTCNDVGIAPI